MGLEAKCHVIEGFGELYLLRERRTFLLSGQRSSFSASFYDETYKIQNYLYLDFVCYKHREIVHLY